jgi:hypothetical protein
MICRIFKHSSDLAGLVGDLYDPARACADSGGRLVAGWRDLAGLEPRLRDGGERDPRDLAGLLRQPLAVLGDQASTEPVWHCEIRTAPGDPELGDSAWMRIAGEVMNRTGLSAFGDESQGVPWVAVHHGGSHVHIVAILARQDGYPVRLGNEFRRIWDALRDMEAEYGLRRTARAGLAIAGPGAPSAAEAARLDRAGFGGPVQARPSTRAGRGGAAAPPRRPGDVAGDAPEPGKAGQRS